MNIIFFILIALSALASGDHHHAEKISLNENAIKNFGIECAPYGKESFPASAVVRSGHEASLYKCSEKSFLRIHFDDVKSGDSVVVKGANFLKTVELSLEEGPSEGHGH